jgi:hypothetical protein
MERVMGEAAFGAVAVGAGAENVRVPREPKLPRGRASASPASIANTDATASSAKSERKSLITILPGARWGARNIVVRRPFVKGWNLRREGALGQVIPKA